MWKLRAGIGLVAVVLIVVGSGGAWSAADDSPKKSRGKAAAAVQSADQPDEDVTLLELNWEETKKLIAEHKGKVVVLDAWSTSCPPCMKEFPNLVKLQEKYGEKIACISFSTDYAGIKKKPPETYREKVLAFLRKNRATFQNVLCNEPADEVFEKMEIASIPAVFIYDRDGKLLKRFDNENLEKGQDDFTYEKDINPFVEKLVEMP
jgi:thiol-disulfide isomerase/thioredoxin